MLAGANLVYGMGMLELGITFSLTQLVIDNEIAKMVKRVAKGIDINDESMAVEVIKQVGPGGNFLSAEHTLRHMREQSHSKLIDRRMWPPWESDGKKDLAERAHEEALSILKNHKPEPLPPEVLSTLHSIVESAEEEVVKKKKAKERT